MKLYEALHPEDPISPDELEILTLESVIVDDIYNDLGFLVKDRLIVLVEAQSTWNPNICVRMLLYLAKTLQEYIYADEVRRRRLYGTKKIDLPCPEFYVMYDGKRGERSNVLSLKDEFFKGSDAVDLKVKILYADDPRDDIIGEFYQFCAILREQVKRYPKDRKKAVAETIRICIGEQVLSEFLMKRKLEVEDMLMTLFTQEEIEKYVMENKLEEGMEKGMEKGIEKSLAAIIRYDKNNLTFEEIFIKIKAMDVFSGFSKEYVRQIYDTV